MLSHISYKKTNNNIDIIKLQHIHFQSNKSIRIVINENINNINNNSFTITNYQYEENATAKLPIINQRKQFIMENTKSKYPKIQLNNAQLHNYDGIVVFIVIIMKFT